MMRILILSFSLLAAPWALAQAPASSPEADTEAHAPGEGEAPVMPVEKKPKYDSNDPIFREVAKEFRCPTCTGLSVLESDAGFSVQIKDQVQEQLSLGKNREQIVEYFVERYGPWILREPPVKGFNALAWIIPIVLLCLGPVLIWLLIWKRRVRIDSHGVRSSAVILQEMQDSLKRMKRENA